jgi:tRNA threonylcarbamoyladenosine biosynthesis protein TsaE
MTATFQLTAQSAEETQRIGRTLGQLLHPGDVICLAGGLGAGKTTFAIGIGLGWGATPPLSSPTFVVVHQHGRANDGQILHHLDAYRIDGDGESIGLEDILNAEGPLLVEWAEHLQALLPAEYLSIALEDGAGSETRLMTLQAVGPRPHELLSAWLAALEEAL